MAEHQSLLVLCFGKDGEDIDRGITCKVPSSKQPSESPNVTSWAMSKVTKLNMSVILMA